MDYGVKAYSLADWGVVRLAAYLRVQSPLARVIGAASLRRGTIANASQLPLTRL